ncbi:TIM44-like domain-containing protein [Kiritimatiellaeota bacterium B1221]|nr:TIM44-like domain-containing protein [Kiritimatiellaeota bacterium B1221]
MSRHSPAPKTPCKARQPKSLFGLKFISPTRTPQPVKRLLLALIFASAALEAFGRAGGGGGYSGGSSGGGSFSGGGSSGGGEGIGMLIYFLIRLCVEMPLVGIPLVIGILTIFFSSQRQVHSARVTRTIRNETARIRTSTPTLNISDLQQRDPGFDPEAFVDRCQQAFLEIQTAWSNQDMTPARRFISDGIFSRFQIQIDMQKGCGIRNHMEDVTVTDARLVSFHSDPAFDTLHVLISATAIDTTVSLENGKQLAGSKQPEPFSEVWTFLRRPGIQTSSADGLIEGFCPNCGAPVTLLDRGACGSCRAVVNSGAYDWVLSEITQLEAWRPPQPEHIPGLNDMQTKDPGFCLQAIEDRTSVFFWRLRAGEFFADADRVAAVAHPDFLSQQAEDFMPDNEGRHHFQADAAVGAVDVSEVHSLPEGEKGIDHVRVRVRWSSHPDTQHIPATLPPRYELSRFREHDFVLIRNSSVRSQISRALVSDHCPGCGAPHTPIPRATCEYCGLPQNDGSHDWVLHSIEPAQYRQRSVASTSDAAFSAEASESLLAATIQLMLADGHIDGKELQLLQKTANRRGIPPEDLDRMIQQARNGTYRAAPLQPNDYEQSTEFLRELVRMCLADGKVVPAERKLLHALVAHLGYANADLDIMIRKERTALYQSAKSQRRARRKENG